MTVTINIPPDVERAFMGAAAFRGLSLEEFVSEVLLPRARRQQQTPVSAESARLQIEEGVPVLYTGQPLADSVTAETLESIRRERDLSNFGTF